MGTEMWILLRGKVRVFKRDYQGNERKLATLQPPSLFGHMAMVDGNRRSATCRVVGDVLLAVLDKGRFQSLMGDLSPPGDVFRRLLITSMWQQLASGNNLLSELMSPGYREHATEEMTSGDLVDAVMRFADLRKRRSRLVGGGMPRHLEKVA